MVRHYVAVIALASIAGCPSQVGPTVSGLITGDYAGQTTGVTTTFVNGTETAQDTSVQNIVQTVNALGEPFDPSGANPMRVGTAFVVAQVGIGVPTISGTVTAVEALQSGFKADYTLVFNVSGQHFAGVGESVFTQLSSNTLRMQIQMSTDYVDNAGSRVRITLSSDGTLLSLR